MSGTPAQAPRQARSALTAERDDVIRRALALPRSQAVELYETLRGFLAAEVKGYTHEEDELAERQACLVELARAASYHGLDGGRCPTAVQYREAQSALDLERSASRIQRRWRTWDEAARAYLGLWHHASPAQRRRRSQSRVNAPYRVAWPEALRLWMATDPEDTTRMAYQRWAQLRNESTDRAQDQVPLAHTLRLTMPLRWPYAVAVGRGELSPSQAFRECLDEALEEAGPLGLGGAEIVALILGIGPRCAGWMMGGLGDPVAHLRDIALYNVADIRAYGQGTSVPPRERGERQSELLGLEDVAARLGRGRTTMQEMHMRMRPETPLVSAGKISGRVYWLPAEVDAYVASAHQPGRDTRATPDMILAELRRWLAHADSSASRRESVSDATDQTADSEGSPPATDTAAGSPPARDGLTRESYRAWWSRRRRGRGSPRGYLHQIEDWPIRWEQWIAIARGETTWEQARLDRLAELRRDAGPLDLIAASGISLMLDCNLQVARRQRRHEAFPAPAAIIGGKRMWSYDDVREHAESRTEPDSLQTPSPASVIATRTTSPLVGGRDYLTREMVGEMLELTDNALSRWHGNEAILPPPAGRVAGVYYWLPDAVERWQARPDP